MIVKQGHLWLKWFDRKWVNYMPRHNHNHTAWVCARVWLCDMCIEYWMRWWEGDYNVIKNEPYSPISKMWERKVAEKKRKINDNYKGVSHFSRTMHCVCSHARTHYKNTRHNFGWSTGLRGGGELHHVATIIHKYYFPVKLWFFRIVLRFVIVVSTSFLLSLSFIRVRPIGGAGISRSDQLSI